MSFRIVGDFSKTALSSTERSSGLINLNSKLSFHYVFDELSRGRVFEVLDYGDEGNLVFLKERSYGGMVSDVSS